MVVYITGRRAEGGSGNSEKSSVRQYHLSLKPEALHTYKVIRKMEEIEKKEWVWRTPNKRRCVTCNEEFLPYNPMQTHCKKCMGKDTPRQTNCLFCHKDITKLREESGLRTLFCTPNEGVNFYILRNRICQTYSNPRLKDELARLLREGKNYEFGEE